MNATTKDEAPPQLPSERNGFFDPPAELARYRETEPVRRFTYPWGEVGWLVTDYALGRSVLGDLRFGKSLDDPQIHEDPTYAEVGVRLLAEGDPTMRAIRAGNFLQMDPPEHTRFRRLLASSFTMGSLRQRLQADIEAIVEDGLRNMAEAGSPADFVATFANPVPMNTICRLFGVPDSGHEIVSAFTFGAVGFESDPEAIAASIREFGELMRELLAQKRAAPGDDLFSQLAASEELEDDELVGVGVLVTAAGVHTTASMLSQGTFALLAERSRWERLVAEPSGVERAAEELLRYLTVNQLDAHTRTALEDVELGGVEVKAGERVHVSLPAANRDPERFPDPDALDIDRDARGHLTLGHGIHVCLGQHLARLEMQIAFTGLLERFPGLRLAVEPDAVPMPPGGTPLNSPYELPVAW